ncbi:MAG: ACDE family multidrug resistance protein [Granulosicoccus sp.]|jgi:ACDE family multidrug resistance protein
MHERRIPEWLRHAPAPSVRGFALLCGIEAVARGILVSVFPIAVYKVLADATLVSEVYFIIGIVSLITGLLVPFLSKYIPRRWLYISGILMFITGSLLATTGTAFAIVTALFLITTATVVMFVCFNAYVLDYIRKIQLSECETSRMFYSAIGWSVGPALGVYLYTWSPPAPFILSATALVFLLGQFLYMRLGNGRLITKAKAPQPNPFAYIPKFVAQPRLLAGWMFAVLRSCGWWVYIVYMPIFAIENGLGERVGGVSLSIANAALFFTPFMLRWMQKRSIKHAVRTGFLISGILFSVAAIVAGIPEIAVACLMLGSFYLILLDICAGLPFLLAVRPFERTEMSAIYSGYRDIAGIATPGAAWLVLLVSPISGIFLAAGLSLMGAWALANTLHPRLGTSRVIYNATDETTRSVDS